MMVILGAQSLLGNVLIKKLSNENFNYLVLVDEDSSTEKEWLEDIQYWHQVSDADSLDWVEENAEEIEFIICCSPVTNDARLAQFVSLWNLGYQHQIPVIGVGKSEKEVKEIISTEQSPFFWIILLLQEFYDPYKNEQKSTESSSTQQLTSLTEVAEAIYYFIRNRQNSGVRTIESALSLLP